MEQEKAGSQSGGTDRFVNHLVPTRSNAIHGKHWTFVSMTQCADSERPILSPSS